MTDNRPRLVGGYGEPEDLADAIGDAYGPDARRSVLDHLAARRVVDGLPHAVLVGDLMRQREEIEHLRGLGGA